VVFCVVVRLSSASLLDVWQLYINREPFLPGSGVKFIFGVFNKNLTYQVKTPNTIEMKTS
jgi:hypothetical protein